MLGSIAPMRFGAQRVLVGIIGLAAAASVCGQDAGGGHSHWAFEAREVQAVPHTRDAAWPRTVIDRFLLARMEAEGLRPAQPAHSSTLLRRVFFDLTGLPPRPEDIERFLADPTAEAFEKKVDQLLASPHFGERWGRHWLDVARFAESSGGGRSLMFKDAWRYRDYVIDSFNEDKAFDVFASEQLAGDLLPDSESSDRAARLIATGFLLLGPNNYEQQDKELLRMDVIDEQIDTIGRAFLGMTLGCARCHDHKFDPVPTTDYYALAGILGSTKSLTPGNVSRWVSRDLPLKKKDEVHWKALAAKLAERQRDLKTARAKLRKSGGKTDQTSINPEFLRGILIDDDEAMALGMWKSSIFAPGYVGARYIHDENKAKGDCSIQYTATLPVAGHYEIRLSYTHGGNRASNVPVTVHHLDGTAAIAVDQTKKPPIDGSFVSLGEFRFKRGRQLLVEISNDGTDGHVIADSIQLIAGRASATSSLRQDGQQKPKVDATAKEGQKARVKVLEKELAELKKQASERPTAMCVVDASEVGDEHVRVRGVVRSLGDVVNRGFLSAVQAEGSGSPKISDDESGRRALAEWIVSETNPLTVRVWVNRVWHWLFGRGIVATPDNFGVTGAVPSHPELLDWLASRFVEKGWSTKALVREMVLSRAYAMSVTPSPGSWAKDPEDRLFSHAHRRRLEAECLRDAMLLVSGQLDLTRGGATIKKLAQYDTAYDHSGHRRSVYVPAFRNAVLEFFDIFDAATPNIVIGARSTSTIPTQALFLMNSPYVRENADHAAVRLLKEPSGLGDRMERVYHEVLGRSPLAEERRLFLAHLRSFGPGAENETAAWASLYHALFACLDFRYLH